MSQSQGDDGAEKHLPPSPARLEKARRDGDVPQSRETNAAASYLGFFLAFTLFSGTSAVAVMNMLYPLLEKPETAIAVVNGAGPSLILTLVGGGVLAIGPFILFPAIGVIASLAAQRSFVFAPSRLKPKLQNISVVANFKKKFGPDGLVEFAKSLAKLVFIFAFLAILFAREFPSLPLQSTMPAFAAANGLLKYGVMFFAVIVLFSVAIAMVDLPWTMYQYEKRHRMSLEELKRESKEDEGDPALKQKRRDRAQQIATNRMMQAVPEATVVVVNPTHYAVALKWDRQVPGAPICVAKGKDEVAARIKEIAIENGVPVQSDPPTARAIFASVEIGEEIKREHYAAVAAVIRFAEVMRAKAKKR